MIDAAEIHGSMASPPTIARAFQRHSGRLPAGVILPSTNTSRGSQPSFAHKASTAKVIASIVAPNMLRRSMSSTSTTPTAHWQRRLIVVSSSARRAAVSFLLSSRPEGRGLHSSTAAATTGPASGPRPASSTPTITSATPDSGGSRLHCRGKPYFRRDQATSLRASPRSRLAASVQRHSLDWTAR